MININEASGRRSLLLLGIGAFILFAILSFPARLAVKLVLPDNALTRDVSGTIWSGKLGILQFPQLTLNDCEWRVRPLAFLTARVSLKVKARVYDGALQSVVTLSPGGKVRLKDLAGVVPVAALAHIIPPNFVDGRIGLDLAKLTVAEQWVIDAHGTVDLVGLQLTSPIQEELGSYEIVFDGTRDNTLQGTISEVDGPLVASGVLSLNADRSWLLDGSVRPEPTASRQLVQALSMLGARSPDGSYPLSARGSN